MELTGEPELVPATAAAHLFQRLDGCYTESWLPGPTSLQPSVLVSERSAQSVPVICYESHGGE